MRRFKLTNAAGQTFDLMRKDAFLHEPDGLGFSRSVSSLLSGESWLVTENDPEQPQPTGEIVFKGYEQYQEFMAFISFGGLYFWYAPLDKWYSAPCIAINLGKSEIEQGTLRLICPITFLLESSWTRKEQIAAESQSGSKIYPYTYPYIYGSQYGGSYVVQNDTSRDAALKLTIFGPVENPRWSVVNGNTVQRGKVNAVLTMGHKIVVDSSDGALELAEYTNENEFVKDLYADGDFSTVRFVKALPGQNIISFEQDGSGDIGTAVEVIFYAESV